MPSWLWWLVREKVTPGGLEWNHHFSIGLAKLKGFPIYFYHSRPTILNQFLLTTQHCMRIHIVSILRQLMFLVHSLQSISPSFLKPTDGHSINYIPQDSNDAWPTFSLLWAGYIPPTPVEPMVAISIWSLKLLYSLICAQSNFSNQSFARLLSDMHKVRLLSMSWCNLMRSSNNIEEGVWNPSVNTNLPCIWHFLHHSIKGSESHEEFSESWYPRL